MATIKSKIKSVKQLLKAERKHYQCKNCKWSDMYTNWCRKYDCNLNDIQSCGSFEDKVGKRDCTQCIHYNSRKNAKTYCKIGIYNCKGVIRKND